MQFHRCIAKYIPQHPAEFRISEAALTRRPHQLAFVRSFKQAKKAPIFFSLTDGENILSDQHGVELSTDSQARDRVQEKSVEIVRNLNPTILVTDAAGDVLCTEAFNESQASISAASDRREALLVQTEELSHVGGWEFDLNSKALTWTAGMFSLYDLPPGAAPSYRASLKTFTARSRRQLDRAIAVTIRSGEKIDIGLKLKSAANISKWVRMSGQCERVYGKATRLFGFVTDISARVAIEQAVWASANHDPLTGLANRGLFQERLSASLDRAKTDGTKVALVLFDLDDLKEVNDTLGHAKGDAIIKQVALRLKSSIREGDTAARIGGDEFALILNTVNHETDSVNFVEKIQMRLREPSEPDDPSSMSGVSIGIAIYPDHNVEAADLLKSADIALYAAKAAGRGALCLFSPEMQLSLLKRVSATENARTALREGQIISYYQPQVAISSGAIVGLEALLRWKHPDKGILPPIEFKDAFEDGELSAAMVYGC